MFTPMFCVTALFNAGSEWSASAVHTVAQFVMSSCPKACHSRSDSFCLLFALCTRNE